MRIIVAGSRGITQYAYVERVLDQVLPTLTNTPVIVSGTARGVDQLGEQYAQEHDLECDRYPADWDRHGKSAGYIRNQKMAYRSDALIAFWDGKSKGTKHMIDIALTAGLVVVVQHGERWCVLNDIDCLICLS